LRTAAKGNWKPDVFHHTLTHLRGPSVTLVRTLRVEPVGSTNQRSSAANTVPAVQSAKQTGAVNAAIWNALQAGKITATTGHSKVIHAPRSGKSVSYVKMSHMPYMGARRPG
jgi:hypothetical protein